jgi:hypothetical protein
LYGFSATPKLTFARVISRSFTNTYPFLLKNSTKSFGIFVVSPAAIWILSAEAANNKINFDMLTS